MKGEMLWADGVSTKSHICLIIGWKSMGKYSGVMWEVDCSKEEQSLILLDWMKTPPLYLDVQFLLWNWVQGKED